MDSKKTPTISPETTLLIEALQAVHRAEDKAYTAFEQVYGGSVVDSVYNQTGLYKLFDSLADELRKEIGLFIDLDLEGILRDSREVAVC